MLACLDCKSKNSPLSETLRLENKIILENIKVVKVNNQDRILFSYPFQCVFSEKFRPELSNYNAALQTSKSLFKKLHNKGLAAQFHAEIVKGIEGITSSCLPPSKLKLN